MDRLQRWTNIKIMGIPIGPVIAAGAQLLGQGANIAAQGSMNKKTRKWNEAMYDRQRRDSLADWTMQNEYNSPEAQMKRFQEAGLNKHLIYGNGTDANAGPVRSSSAPSWNPKSPEVDGGAIVSSFQSSLSQMYDLELKAAQTDNLKAQNTVATQEALLKAAQTASTLQGTEKSKFELDLASDLKETTLEAAKANLNKLKVDTDVTLSANDRAALQNAQSLQKGVEEILTLRLQRAKTSAEVSQIQEQIKDIRANVKLKQLDIDLKSKGIMPGDPMYMRMGARVLDNLGPAAKKSAVDAGNWLREKFTIGKKYGKN